MAQNPFQYAQELRDPLWGGYYLRARWYAPDLQVFLSRDPRRNLNRYGYTDGNPVMRVDPSGMGYQHSGFSRGLNDFLNRDVGGEGHGPWGEVWGGLSRLALGPLIGALQLVATPETFWHTATHSVRQAPFLWAGVAGEVATAPFPAFSFTGHLVFDAAFGAGQSALSALSHNLHRFRVASFFHGLEFSASGMFYARYILGFAYRQPDQPLSAGDVENELGSASGNRFSLFRFHDPEEWTSPFFGQSREGLLAVGDLTDRDPNDVIRVFGVTFADSGVLRQGLYTDPVSVEQFLGNVSDQLFGGSSPERFEYVGQVSGRVFQEEFFNNPSEYPRALPQGQLRLELPSRTLGVSQASGSSWNAAWSANSGSASTVRSLVRKLGR